MSNNDFISRQALINICKETKIWCPEWDDNRAFALDVLKKQGQAIKNAIVTLPSAEVREVVCCKNCKYSYWQQEPCHGKAEYFCNLLGGKEVDKNFFCGAGKRKVSNSIDIHYVVGDATVPQGTGNKIICHICNDQGGWGAGFVLALSKKWTEPEEHYRKDMKNHKLRLGDVQMITVEKDILVANLIAQHGYRSKKNPVPVSYVSLSECLGEVAKWASSLLASVHMPRIGCGLGGGDWNLIEKIIQEELCSKGIPVFVYDLKENTL